MNPHENTQPPPNSPPDLHDISHDASLSASSPSPALIQTGHSSVTVLSRNVHHYRASPDQDGGHDPVPSASPSSEPRFVFRSSPQSSLVSVPSPVSAPTPPPRPTPPSCQVSIIVPSPDLHPSPFPTQCSEDDGPDLECSVCFSQFNNVFRCPKMLQCKHTFCLECLARINVKSSEPGAIQCPLCRGLTPLPALGLPRLATNLDMLSYLPAAMQRVYSIRFQRSKGKLEVKRSSEGQRSLTSLSMTNRSLDVGLPSPPSRAIGEVPGGGGGGGVGDALFRLTGRPACRAVLLTSVVMMMALLTGIIIFLILFNRTE